MQPGGSTPVGTSSEPILVAHDIHRSYGARRALRSLSFSLLPGRVLGFLGPNGAGKTTTIRVLTTILEPTSGHFFVDGIKSDRPAEIRRRIGVLPEGLGFPKHGTGRDYLTYFGRLYGRAAAEAAGTAAALLDVVGLANRADALIETYSHGMRQRLGIARALVNDPRVVFLDEPTLGLDPRGQQELLALIQRIARERNAGVVLSSHLLTEIEGICDDVVIMNAGQVVAKGTVAEVIGQGAADRTRSDTVRVRVPPLEADRAASLAGRVDGVDEAVVDPGGWVAVRFGTDGPSVGDPGRNRVLDTLIDAGVPIVGYEVAGGRLQDVFLQLTAESIE